MSSNTSTNKQTNPSFNTKHQDRSVTGLEASSIAANVSDVYEYEDELDAIYAQYYDSEENDTDTNVYSAPTRSSFRTHEPSAYRSHTTTHPLFHGTVTFRRRFSQTCNPNELIGGGWEQNEYRDSDTRVKNVKADFPNTEKSNIDTDSGSESDSGDMEKGKVNKTAKQRKLEKTRERIREYNVAGSKFGR